MSKNVGVYTNLPGNIYRQQKAHIQQTNSKPVGFLGLQVLNLLSPKSKRIKNLDLCRPRRGTHPHNPHQILMTQHPHSHFPFAPSHQRLKTKSKPSIKYNCLKITTVKGIIVIYSHNHFHNRNKFRPRVRTYKKGQLLKPKAERNKREKETAKEREREGARQKVGL